MPASSLLTPPALLTVRLQQKKERSPTTPYGVRAFGAMLSPDYIFGAGALDQ